MTLTISSAPATSERVDSSALECLVIVGAMQGLQLTVPQLIQDSALESAEVDYAHLVHCARHAGMKAKAIRLDWDGLSHLEKALPAIVRLKTGASMVLVAMNATHEEAPQSVTLRDPNAAADALLTLDWLQFQEAWSGDVVLVRRNYDLMDEEKPFGMGLIGTLILRERKLVRDIALSAFVLSIFALAPIIFWRLVSSKVLYYKSMGTFTVLTLGMGVIIVFEAAFTYLRSYLLLFLASRVDTRLAEYMFERLIQLPVDYYERTQIGQTMHDVNEIWKIREFLTGQVFGVVLDSLVLLIFLPVMFVFSPTLTAIVLAFCVMIVLWLLGMLPHVRKATGAVIRVETDRASFLYQTLAGIRTVKSLALESRQRKMWDVHVARCAKARDNLSWVSAVARTGVLPFERLAVTGSFAVGVYIAVTSTNSGYMMGSLFAFLMLSQRVAGPLMQMAGLVTQADEARAAVECVRGLVNRKKEEGHGEAGVRKTLEGQVEFSNVRFFYPGGLTPALDGVSFDVPVGTTLGVVGRSGSGKTTVTRLLQRLHSDYEGLIKIDGVDVREYNIAHLRRSLGIVLQENFLFSGTIRENIAVAKADATFDDVVRAARLAGAEEFIDRLPRGYDTVIYEGSPNLSGGQRQRLAIARALIVDPRILILDEATSALDPDSEAIVNASIRKIAHGRTVIAISHRLSSLVHSDAILVLERGKFLDMGTHQELLERCEIYAGLWHQQNGHIERAAVIGNSRGTRGVH
ncbi:peptidase domain-containing ABC transporter [Rhodoblastus acidophilus]|uniref:Peptidase domain-containing ABC transporter n=1 Tax=Candidatus Rhodoblastus alkanivorans TaxID=2954117 RepID=A0ABS9Z4E4_9HYPH|nr:peptidase domain-containing ABC transporter [Candidatus Rhodoblastus alkanivorans]MCI4679958.1 peptidase domain-containing ABC transporter [Candidatus Rhodoblastus alkanivorans]MCI4682341.1 peptidase domain-containing ABC transporter [Candidatus Rhodoblastus alkanivorans]MDI4639644.1 peptidase domain-containing ABC transporter [Rhodoblastus acidophilus]